MHQYRNRHVRQTTWFREGPLLLLCQGGKNNNRQKPLIAISKKDEATLSQRLQCILLIFHKYRVSIIYKPGPDLSIADWLSRQNHKEDKDDETQAIKINTIAIDTATDVPKYMPIYKMQQATAKANHLQQIREHIIRVWPESKNEVP